MLLLAALQPARARAQCVPLPAPGPRATAPAPSFTCRFDAALTRMFTPLDVPRDTYRVYVTDSSFDTVVTAFRKAAPGGEPEGAWTTQQMDPLDAYGNGGLYDRGKVARLYVGVRPRVSRGPIVVEGRTVRSITIISPYPVPGLSRLNPGTLIIDFAIERRDRGW